jgi:hypothetical protein
MAVSSQRLDKSVRTAWNADATIELLDVVISCGPNHVKYSVCRERKICDYFTLYRPLLFIGAIQI